ncbi:MAG: hypothetical protein AAFQ85_03430 [Pseudomonadota bacterium]
MVRSLHKNAHGVIGDKLLLSTNISNPDYNSENGYVDCCYIITLGVRKNILQIVREMKTSAKNIVIIANEPTNILNESSRMNAETLYIDDIDAFDWYDDLEININPSVSINPHFDIGKKRTFALRHARAHNYKAICMIDDDIVFPGKASHCISCANSRLESGVSICCFYSLRAPDVSTIDLISSAIRKRSPRVSISGNFVVLNAQEISGVFPHIYNEDWIFFIANIYAGNRIEGIGIVEQLPRSDDGTDRVAFEQFGEIIASGIRVSRLKGIHLGAMSKEDWEDFRRVYESDLRQLQIEAESSARPDWMNLLDRALNAVDGVDSGQLYRFARCVGKELLNEK